MSEFNVKDNSYDSLERHNVAGRDFHELPEEIDFSEEHGAIDYLDVVIYRNKYKITYSYKVIDHKFVLTSVTYHGASIEEAAQP